MTPCRCHGRRQGPVRGIPAHSPVGLVASAQPRLPAIRNRFHVSKRTFGRPGSATVERPERCGSLMGLSGISKNQSLETGTTLRSADPSPASVVVDCKLADLQLLNVLPSRTNRSRGRARYGWHSCPESLQTTLVARPRNQILSETYDQKRGSIAAPFCCPSGLLGLASGPRATDFE